jgi:hypothetical protein
MSPESLQDIRSWDLTQVDEITRREIFVAGDSVNSLGKIFTSNFANHFEEVSLPSYHFV